MLPLCRASQIEENMALSVNNLLNSVYLLQIFAEISQLKGFKRPFKYYKRQTLKCYDTNFYTMFAVRQNILIQMDAELWKWRWFYYIVAYLLFKMFLRKWPIFVRSQFGNSSFITSFYSIRKKTRCKSKILNNTLRFKILYQNFLLLMISYSFVIDGRVFFFALFRKKVKETTKINAAEIQK